MKEILQTKKFKLKSSTVCAYAHLHDPVFLSHIENVDKELVAIEAKIQTWCTRKEQQEFVGTDPAEEQALEANFANPDLQQGKPQFIYPNVLHKFKFLASPGSF